MTSTRTEPAGDGEDVGALVAELQEARARVEELEARVAELGEAELERVADAYNGANRLLERYEDRATDYDDFEGYVEFQEAFVDFVEGLPEDLPAREGFEAADETFRKSRLSVEDFERAREQLSEAREYASLLSDYREARGRRSDAEHAVRSRLRELEARVDDLERTLALGAADLDAPVEELRGPVEAYNEAVTEAFDSFRRGVPAREVFALVDVAGSYPLVGFREPPTRLREYVESSPAGEEPIPKLLEYADYSASKLDHYVAEPHELKRHVATNRTYLDRLDAEPLTVEWPPPPASKLRYRTREYEAVVRRFAPEGTVAALRAVRRLATDPGWYGDLREAAHAVDELDEDQRSMLERDAVEPALRAAREKRDRLREALE
jgi:polyhydroxyalkanoate synthesis regulator phasin